MTTKHTPSGWTDKRPLGRNKLVVALEAERDQLRASNAELVAALEYALGALDADVSTAPMGEKQARLAQSWLRGKFGEQARAALAKARQ